jgi:hypothetical protein
VSVRVFKHQICDYKICEMSWICHTVKQEESFFTTAEDLFIFSLMQKWSWVTVYKNWMTSVNMSFNVQTAWAHSLCCNIFSLLNLNDNAERLSYHYIKELIWNFCKALWRALHLWMLKHCSQSCSSLSLHLELLSWYNSSTTNQWVYCNLISCERTFLNLSVMLKHLIDHFLVTTMLS